MHRCFGNDHQVERLSKILVQRLDLVDASLDVFINAGFYQVFIREVAIVNLVTILSMWPFAPVRTIVGEVQGGIVAQFRPAAGANRIAAPFAVHCCCRNVHPKPGK